MKPLELRVHEKHPTVDAYRFGPSYTPYAIVAPDKRFTDAELSAEFWAAAYSAESLPTPRLVAITVAFLRFAEADHYDEADK